MTDGDYYDPIEEAEDIADARAALAAIKAGAPTIPHEQVWAELGLSDEEGERDAGR